MWMVVRDGENMMRVYRWRSQGVASGVSRAVKVLQIATDALAGRPSARHVSWCPDDRVCDRDTSKSFFRMVCLVVSVFGLEGLVSFLVASRLRVMSQTRALDRAARVPDTLLATTECLTSTTHAKDPSRPPKKIQPTFLSLRATTSYDHGHH
jgi:hypothetical protein